VGARRQAVKGQVGCVPVASWLECSEHHLLKQPCLPTTGRIAVERVRWQREQALASASMAELEALLQRAAVLLEAAGIRWVDVSGAWPCCWCCCCLLVVVGFE